MSLWNLKVEAYIFRRQQCDCLAYGKRSAMLIVFVTGHPSQAAIAQLGERQTEDLKVPSSILGLGIIACGV